MLWKPWLWIMWRMVAAPSPTQFQRGKGFSFATGWQMHHLKSVLPPSLLCRRVTSSPKLLNIINSVYHSSLWKALQWVCWIILPDKCFLRENSTNVAVNTRRGFYPADFCGRKFVSALCSLIDLIFAITHRKHMRHLSSDTFPRKVSIRTPLPSSIALLFKEKNKLANRLWSAFFQTVFFFQLINHLISTHSITWRCCFLSFSVNTFKMLKQLCVIV